MFRNSPQLFVLIQSYAGSHCYSEKIVENRIKIRDMIEEFFEEKVKHLVAKLDPAPPVIYTIDFYVSPDLDHLGIIEINEGPPIAGFSFSFSFFFFFVWTTFF